MATNSLNIRTFIESFFQVDHGAVRPDTCKFQSKNAQRRQPSRLLFLFSGIGSSCSRLILGASSPGEKDGEQDPAEQEVPAEPGHHPHHLLHPDLGLQVFFKSDSLHPYCKNACEPVTMCGEVRVPEEHLEVSKCLFLLLFEDMYHT